MKYKFEDLIFNITEKKKPVEEDKYNYIGLEHLESGNLFISKWGSDTAPEGEKIVMKKGDVLFGKRRAYQKKVAISPIDGIFSAHGMVLRPKEDVICKEFLPFFISSETFLNEAIRISVGGLSPTVNWKDIKELEFDLPSLAEQKVLAEKLWAAYEVKQSYLKMIAATEEMVKSQFIEMFVFHELNLNSPSKDFESMCFDDTSSATKIPAGEYLQEGKYAIYDQSQEKDIAGFSNTEQGLCRNYPAVLFGDHSRVVKYINEPFFIGADGVKIIRPKADKLIPEFLYYDLKYHNIPNTGYNRHFKYIKMISLTKASLEEQSRFLSIAHQADKSISELRKSVDAIDKVIKSLINENI